MTDPDRTEAVLDALSGAIERFASHAADGDLDAAEAWVRMAVVVVALLPGEFADA